MSLCNTNFEIWDIEHEMALNVECSLANTTEVPTFIYRQSRLRIVPKTERYTKQCGVVTYRQFQRVVCRQF